MSYRALVILIVVLGVAAMALRPAVDTDTWWHLRAGEWILENGQVPTTDVFSHTAFGREWRYPGWLAQVALLGAYGAGGLSGLTIFTGILAGLGMAFLWPLLQGPILLRAAVALLAAATAAVYWAARPHIITFALAAYFLWVLERRRRGRRDWVVWTLPLGMAVWVNVHGGFAVGFLLMAMYLIGTVIDVGLDAAARRAPWRRAWGAHQQDILTLAGVLVLCVAAASLNPHGPEILVYPLRTVAIPVLQAHILEWQAPDFQQPGLYPFLVMLVGLVVSLGASPKRASATQLVVTAGWAVLALLAVRNVAVFALAAAPLLAQQIDAALEPLTGSGSFADQPGRFRRIAHAVAGGVVIFAGMSWTLVQLSPERQQAHLSSLVPVKAVEVLRRSPSPGPILNDYNWGGYLLWAAYPEYPTFVDGRTDVFPEVVFEDYLRLWSAQGAWEETLDSYAVRIVLLPPTSPLVDGLVGNGWSERYRDEMAVILVDSER